MDFPITTGSVNLSFVVNDKGQILVPTYPMIGNYGVPDDEIVDEEELEDEEDVNDIQDVNNNNNDVSDDIIEEVNNDNDENVPGNVVDNNIITDEQVEDVLDEPIDEEIVNDVLDEGTDIQNEDESNEDNEEINNATDDNAEISSFTGTNDDFDMETLYDNLCLFGSTFPVAADTYEFCTAVILRDRDVNMGEYKVYESKY